MTPKERAEQVTSKLYDHGCKTDNQAMLADLSCADCAMEVQQAIESAIMAAVLSERAALITLLQDAPFQYRKWRMEYTLPERVVDERASRDALVAAIEARGERALAESRPKLQAARPHFHLEIKNGLPTSTCCQLDPCPKSSPLVDQRATDLA